MLECSKKFSEKFGVQVLAFILLSGLAIWANHLAVELQGVSLSDFISQMINEILGEEKSYSPWINIFFPVLMYICSGVLLIWMAISNFVVVSSENIINKILRVLLGICQVVMFGLFVYLGSKLFLYYIAFAILITIVVGLFIAERSFSSK